MLTALSPASTRVELNPKLPLFTQLVLIVWPLFAVVAGLSGIRYGKNPIFMITIALLWDAILYLWMRWRLQRLVWAIEQALFRAP